MLSLVSSEASLTHIVGATTQERVSGKVSQIVVGSSTWHDVERVLGEAYVVEEPVKDAERKRVWHMYYPMVPEYGTDVRFVINRVAGTVEAVRIGFREPPLVRELVREHQIPYCSSEEKWGKPQYLGLTVGESTRAEVEKSLGKGVAAECDAPGRRLATLQYDGVTGFQGKVTVGIGCSSRVVEYIMLEPVDTWPLGGAIETFGDGFCYWRYMVTDDPDEAESNPELQSGLQIEHPRGIHVGIENPAKGLVLVPNSFGRIRMLIFQPERDGIRGGAGRTEPRKSS